MTFWYDTPADRARDDLAAARNRYRRWRRTVMIAAGCACVDVGTIVGNLLVGVPWWSYAMLLISLSCAALLGTSALLRMRRASEAVTRAQHDLAHAERHSQGPQDAVPDDDNEWGPYR